MNLLGGGLAGRKNATFSPVAPVSFQSQTIADKVVARIYGNGRGWAFSQTDFADLGTRRAVDGALIRLTEKATIRRVIRGIYEYPRYSELLQQPMSPDIHQVASALARKFGWRIQPSGQAVLNLIGISTQVPGHYVFHSDGPKREYQVGQVKLQFNHGPLKEAGFRQKESGVIVQSLRTLGEDHIHDQVIQRIRNWLPEAKRRQVLRDTRSVTGWVYAAIARICEEPSDG